MRYLVLVLAVAACSNLPPIDAHECGNGVLEEHEDCDDPNDENCIECSVACESDADCAPPSLPAARSSLAYHCGYDEPQRLCHAAGGQFVEVGQPRPYDVLGFGVVDVDGDHIGDAVGLAQTQVVVRYGDESTPLVDQSTAVIPTLVNTPAVGDINHDGTIDLVVPTRDGLTAYTGAQGTMVPYLLAIQFSAPGGSLDALHPVKIDNQYSLVFFQNDSALGVGIVSVTQGGQAGGGEPTILPLCDQMFAPKDFAATDVSTYDVSAVYGHPAIMIALEAPRGDSTTELCAFTVEEVSGVTPTFPITTLLSTTVTASGRPTLAALDPTTPCPSLVSFDRNRYAASGLTSCLLGTSPAPLVDAVMAPNLAGVVGRVPLSPPISGQAPDALVLQGGVESYEPGANELTPIYLSDTTLSQSDVGDFNGDGKTDAVVVGAGQSSFDVLYRLGSSANGIMFLRQRLGTDNAITGVLTGDFDGNTFSDVVAFESVPDAMEGHDVVAIAYGTRDQVLAPVEVGAFGHVVSAAKVQLFDSTDQAGVVDDLAVIERRRNVSSTLLGLLHGTPQRGLIPYLDPRPSTPQSPSYLGSAFAAVARGNFVTPVVEGVVDLVTISVPDVGLGTSATIWRLAGVGPGIVAAPAPDRSTFASIDAGYCVPGFPPPTLCVNGGQVAAYRQGDHDVFVALDAVHGYGVVIDPAQITGNPFGPNQALALTPTSPIMTHASQVTTVLVADSDGDGVQELIFAYAGDDSAHPGDVKSCKVSGTDLDCSNDLFANEPMLAGTCFGVATGAVTLQGQTKDDDSQASLIVSCVGGVFRLDHASDGYHKAPLLPGHVTPSYFDIADVTGDLVPDFLVLESRQLRVFRQCTSREVGSCQ